MSDLQSAFEAREIEVREAFEAHDGDGNGEIDLGEFRAVIETLGLTVDEAEAERLFDSIDEDESGLIGYEEFYAWWSEAVA